MKRSQTTSLFIVALITAFWAYTIINSLIKAFPNDITYIDLGAIFILGLISGLMLGLAFALRREQ